MKFSSAFSAVAFAALAYAVPVKRNNTHQEGSGSGENDKGFTDIDIVQYALSLEHIEGEFYSQGISNFTAEDFANAGYSPHIRARYEQIVANEKIHVETLSAALVAAGAEPVALCNYSFPITTIEEFIETTHTFENVGGSAWNGASSLIEDPSIAALAGGILSVEARQAAWIGATVFHQNPWNTPFETPLNFRQIYSIAKAFVVSCPEDFHNILGYGETFPRLEVSLAYPTGTFDFERPASGSQPLYAAFIQGTQFLYAPIDASGQVKLPEGLSGYVFALVTTQREGAVTDEQTVAGPVILQFPYDSRGDLIAATAG